MKSQFINNVKGEGLHQVGRLTAGVKLLSQLQHEFERDRIHETYLGQGFDDDDNENKVHKEGTIQSIHIPQTQQT